MELTRMQEIELALKGSAPMTLAEILEEEIRCFRGSEQYRTMVKAEEYYRNRSDIQRKSNDIPQRSNAKIEHPLLRKLVNQKADYLLSKPYTVESDNKAYAQALDELMDHQFRRRIRSLGAGAVKSGIAWLAPYFDDDGTLRVMRLPSTEVIPLWQDAEHSRLSGYIRAYDQEVYEGRDRRIVLRVELWDTKGVHYYRNDGHGGTVLRPDTDNGPADRPHFKVGAKSYNWEAVPLAWLKYNDEELPLWWYVRDIIDDINWQTSVTADVLRDVVKFIYVLKGYGGQDLAEFLTDLRKHLAIQVEAGEHSGVDKLQADVDVTSVLSYLDNSRKNLYDLAAAVDTKDADLGNASGVAIRFRYMDLDTDCANLAAGLQETFLQLKPFLDAALQLAGKGDFTGDEFAIIFNADLPVNEGDIIDNIVKSESVLSKRTLLEQHPWVVDVDQELKQLDEERQQAMEQYGTGLFDDPADQGRGTGTPVNGGDDNAKE